MSDKPHITVVIPALNEEQAIGNVLRGLLYGEHVPPTNVIVADNGSTDRTAEIAAEFGVTVVHEPRRGYGAACLAGLAALVPRLSEPGVAARSAAIPVPCDIVVFIDGDASDFPEEMNRLIAPIESGEADLVIGSRVLDPSRAQPGSLTLPQRFGNALASRLIRWRWGVPCTDLGPFRAIRYEALKRLQMDDMDYGWTVQMQARAARHGLRIVEVPVSYRRRIGLSKISGTVRGVVGAGTKILRTIGREALQPLVATPPFNERVIVFTRYPESGTSKTRLIPALGPNGAADLQRHMTRHTLAQADTLRGQRNTVSIEVRFDGGGVDAMKRAFGGHNYRSQGGGDLGDRMSRAFEDAFHSGAQRVITIGSDCPDVDARLLGVALDSLNSHDVVLGPATDGGYYLIGLRQAAPSLFRDVDWGTGTVRERTLAIAADLGLSVQQLALLTDIDEPQDLAKVAWAPPVGDSQCDACSASDAKRARLSIIIPALNEEAHLNATLDRLACAANTEILLVDGGSEDATVSIARSRNVRVLQSAPGRAVQMNAGAAAAKGEYLLFLHADTLMPETSADRVREVLGDASVVAGAFSLALDAPGLRYRLIERGVAARCRLLRMPYGDQAIFLRRETFRAAGGFAEMPIMEDYDLISRLKRRGRIVVCSEPVITSARRWRDQGPIRTTLRNQVAIIGYRLGVSPAAIARFLRGVPARQAVSTSGRSQSNTCGRAYRDTRPLRKEANASISQR